MAHYHQGKFKPKNPEKYKGDPTAIIYRSSWELKFMIWLDSTDSILSWGSEETVVPYKSPIDGRMHRYFPDFTAKVRTKSGIKKYMFEIKPKIQTQPPKKQSRITKQYIQKVSTYAINEYKWKYAKEFCRKNGMEFALLTEDDLKITS